MELRQIVETTTVECPQVAARCAAIHLAALSRSQYLDGPNFQRIHPHDLAYLFDAYDQAFFAGQVRVTLGDAPLQFGFSPRMTSAAGKTVVYADQRGGVRYEITVASSLLFGCFQADDHRPITASGILCRDRLEALQRVLEHEMIHLIEMLLWRESSCRQERFASISRRFFGHTVNYHQLITPKERAIAKFGVVPGSKVRFDFEGQEHTGRVNRISKRATVLVEDDRGMPYTDGRRYRKFYVPVSQLRVVGDDD